MASTLHSGSVRSEAVLTDLKPNELHILLHAHKLSGVLFDPMGGCEDQEILENMRENFPQNILKELDGMNTL